LSGLGDSDGDIPEDLLEFINSGGYAEIVSSVVKRLMGRFNLSGVVIVGHCAGSISALYAAAASNDCKGLVLMDQYFYLSPRVKQSKVFKRLSGVASHSGLDGGLMSFCGLLKDFWMSSREDRPPENANFALLQRWKEVATKGLPILLLKSPGQMTFRVKPGKREFDYINYVLTLAGRQSKVSVQVVEGADHSFANRAGRDAVRQYTEHWLSFHFPLVEAGDSEARRMLSAASESRVNHENHIPCL
jgi:pimeloyl-ACP methyl ester carboxylesterase